MHILSHLLVVSKWVQSENKQKWQEHHLSPINQHLCLILGVWRSALAPC